MSIVCEYRHWENGTYYFRSTQGTTPICKAYRAGEGWEVLFFRGPNNLGPYSYDSIERAKNHLFRYLEPREEALMGERHHYNEPLSAVRYDGPRCVGLPLETRHPRHRKRIKNWWATGI